MLYNGILSSHKMEWKQSVQNATTMRFHLYEMSRVGKSTATEIRLVVSREGG